MKYHDGVLGNYSERLMAVFSSRYHLLFLLLLAFCFIISFFSVILLGGSPAFSADQNVTSNSGSAGAGTLWNAINSVGSGETITFQGPSAITYASGFPTLGGKAVTFVTNPASPTVFLQSTDANNTRILYSTSTLNVSGSISFLNDPSNNNTVFGFMTTNNALNITSDFSGSAYVSSTNTQNSGSMGAAAFYSSRNWVNFKGGISGDIYVDSTASRPAAAIYAQQGVTIDGGYAENASITVNNTSTGSNAYAFGIRALNDSITFSNGDFAGTVVAFSEGGRAHAIYADEDLSFAGDVTDTASFSASSSRNSACALRGDNVQFDGIFAADVVASGITGYGIYGSKSLTFKQGISSDSSISVTATSIGYGIKGKNIDINNGMSCDLSVSGDSNAYGLHAYDDISIGGVFDADISVTSENGQAWGIYADNLYGVDTTTTLEIAGSVIATGETGAKGIYLTSSGGTALDLYITGTLAGICNGSGTAYAILTEASTDDTVVVASEAGVSGDIDLGGGNDSITLQGQGTVSGSIVNIEQFTKSGYGIWRVDGDLILTDTPGVSAVLQQGGLIVNGTFRIPNGTFTIPIGSTLAGNINLDASLTSAGLISPGNSIGTVTVSGDYTQSASAELIMELNGEGEHDALVVGGTANLDGKLSVYPEVGQYSNRTYDIVTSSARNGEFAVVTIDYPDSETISFTIEYTPTNVNVVSHRKSYEDVTKEEGGNEAEVALAAYLDTVAGLAPGDMALLITLLDFLSAEDIIYALKQMLPNNVYAGRQTTQQVANLFRTSTNEHLLNARMKVRQARRKGAAGNELVTAPLLMRGTTTGMNAGDTPESAREYEGMSLYARFIGGFGEYGREDWCNKFSYLINGVDAGVDFLLSDSAIVGMSFGYAASSIRMDNVFPDKSYISSYRAGVYGTYFKENWYADAALSYVLNDNTFQRNLSIPSTTVSVPGIFTTTIAGYSCIAESSFFSHTMLTHLGTGYDFTWGNFTASPMASLDYAALFFPSYKETGASVLNLNIHEKTIHSLQSGLGLRLAYTIKNTTQPGWFTPELRAEWRHEFLNDDTGITATMEGIPQRSFTVDAPTQDTNMAIVGGGFTASLGKYVEATALYQARVSENFLGHNINAALQVNF